MDERSFADECAWLLLQLSEVERQAAAASLQAEAHTHALIAAQSDASQVENSNHGVTGGKQQARCHRWKTAITVSQGLCIT